jgi:hypothetical protein
MSSFRQPMRLISTLLAASFCLLAAPGSAQDKKSDEPCVPGKPCSNAQPAAPAKKPAARTARAHKKQKKVEGPIAMWPAFRMLPGGASSISVQLSEKVQPQVIKGPATLTYVLPGFHVPVHNNTHALMTQYFRTPVADARLTETKTDARLTIALRAVVEPKVHMIEGDGGKSFELQIEFPAGDFRPETHDMHGPRGEADQSGHDVEPGAPPPRHKKHSKASKTPLGPPAP